MKKILVLLSTYNGERYLSEQLQSLWEQKEVKIGILVRDDGSTDNTVQVLNEYKDEGFPITITEGMNCGSAKSFCELMVKAYSYINTYDYFCFCDQDDVWKEDKLAIAVDYLSKNEDQGAPSLYMSAYQMVDAELNMIPTPVYHPKISLPGAFASNCATGCTMVFNRELLSAVMGYSVNDIIMHDYWMYLVCLAIGGNIYYDPTPHILYRQHGNNVIGGMKDSFSKRWKVRLGKLFKNGDCYKSRLAIKLLDAKNIQIDEGERKFLEAVSTCTKCSSKIHILMTRDFWINSLDKNLQNLGLVLTGKF